jgi:uncharacterized membrane protein
LKADFEIKDFWDLILLVLTSMVLVFVIVFLPENPLRKVIGLPFILFFPGYALISFLFPEKRDLDNIERIALSFGLSIAITPLIGLILNYTPFGIRLMPILLSLSSFNMTFSVLSIYRRMTARDPFIPRIDLKKLKEDLEWDKSSRLDKVLTWF